MRLDFLINKISSGQAVNDLNWLRLRNWRETLAMVFDPPLRRLALENITNIDIDFEGDNPVQALLMAAWIADRLNWTLELSEQVNKENFYGKFRRANGGVTSINLVPLPVGIPSIHPGQIIGMRIICKPSSHPEGDLCVILASKSGECMRLESGGMANMELLEEVVPIQKNSVEMDVARLLSSSRGTTSPLLSSAAPIASKLLQLAKANL